MKKVLGIWFALMCVFTVQAVAQNTFSGRVTDPNGASTVRVQGATINVQPGNYTAMTDVNGEFSISGIPSGQYQVTLSKDGCGSQTMDLTIQNNKHVVLSIECGAQQQPGAFSFSGIVTREAPTGPTDTPVPGATVTVQPGGYVATTDAQGRFMIPAIPMGQYQVTVSAPGFSNLNMDLRLDSDKQVVLGLQDGTPGG